MRARHGAELLRPDDAGEAHEVADRVFVDAAGVGVAEIGEPLDRDCPESGGIGPTAI
jgi:hypothetical protein